MFLAQHQSVSEDARRRWKPVVNDIYSCWSPLFTNKYLIVDEDLQVDPLTLNWLQVIRTLAQTGIQREEAHRRLRAVQLDRIQSQSVPYRQSLKSWKSLMLQDIEEVIARFQSEQRESCVLFSSRAWFDYVSVSPVPKPTVEEVGGVDEQELPEEAAPAPPEQGQTRQLHVDVADAGQCQQPTDNQVGES